MDREKEKVWQEESRFGQRGYQGGHQANPNETRNEAGEDEEDLAGNEDVRQDDDADLYAREAMGLGDDETDEESEFEQFDMDTGGLSSEMAATGRSDISEMSDGPSDQADFRQAFDMSDDEENPSIEGEDIEDEGGEEGGTGQMPSRGLEDNPGEVDNIDDLP